MGSTTAARAQVATPPAAADPDAARPPLGLRRATGPVVLDGDPADPAWTEALRVDTFYETAFGDNRKPVVQTTARLMYDDRYLYLAIECQDPDPGRIRAPYVDRDQVFGDQD